MNRKEIEQMEKYWEKYHKSIPDYPILEERRRQKIDLILSYIMAFLIGMLFVSMVMLVYLINFGGV